MEQACGRSMTCAVRALCERCGFASRVACDSQPRLRAASGLASHPPSSRKPLTFQ